MVVQGEQPALSPELDKADLLAFLRELGATPEQIADAEARCSLVQLGADVVLSAADALTVRDVAAGSGLALTQVLEFWTTLGVAVPGPDVPMFSTDDVELVRALCSIDLLEHAEGDELLRVVGSALARVADAAVAFYVHSVESDLADSGAGLSQLARKSAMAATKALDLGAGLGAVFTHILRDAIERQRRAQAHVSDRALSRVAVGFVDLVGFTPLSHRMASRELSAFVIQFENQAFKIASEHGGRIVKHIGDEVMFVALEAPAACRLALGLMKGFAGEGIQPRGGLAFGDVVTRQGDYYGEVVNLASRLSDLAIPGEVLADDELRRATAGAGIAFDPAGRRQLKGFEDPVAVFAVRDEPAAHG